MNSNEKKKEAERERERERVRERETVRGREGERLVPNYPKLKLHRITTTLLIIISTY